MSLIPSQSRWEEPLTPEERTMLIEKWVTAIEKRRLVMPVLFALEMHRPLGFLASQSMIVGAPFVSPLIGLERWQDASRLLGDKKAMDELIQKLEDLEQNLERKGAKK